MIFFKKHPNLALIKKYSRRLKLSGGGALSKLFRVYLSAVFLALFLTGVLAHTHAQSTEPRAADTALMINAYEAIVRNYPPNLYFHLNLGLSTVPWTLLMQKDPRFSAQKRTFAFAPVEHLNYLAEKPITFERLSNHLDVLLPPPEVLGDRDLVLNRILLEGATIKRILPHILRYLKENGYNSKLSLNIAFSEDEQARLLAELETSRTGSLDRITFLTKSYWLKTIYARNQRLYADVSPIEPYEAEVFEARVNEIKKTAQAQSQARPQPQAHSEQLFEREDNLSNDWVKAAQIEFFKPRHLFAAEKTYPRFFQILYSRKTGTPTSIQLMCNEVLSADLD